MTTRRDLDRARERAASVTRLGAARNGDVPPPTDDDAPDVDGPQASGTALDAVELAALFDAVDATLARYIAFPTAPARHAVTLWLAHCHTLPAFDSTPRLALLSPEKGSGKTRTLEVCGLLAPSPIHAVNISAAALFRLVARDETMPPTLLLDEADTYLGPLAAKLHEDLRGLVNAGHRRGAMAYRGEITGKSVAVVAYPAFAPVALAGIGDLPDTILDRAVLISMKRRAPNEHIEPFRERVARPDADRLRQRLAAWGMHAAALIGDPWPDLPPSITDRAADVWEPLIAVADLADEPWPTRARAAAVELHAARTERDPSLGQRLLADCHRVFTSADADRLTSEQLVEALVALDDAPWHSLRGNPLDVRGLARRVHKYDVRPAQLRLGDRNMRGYRREDFFDAWQRYLPADQVRSGRSGRERPDDDEPEQGHIL